MGYIQGAVIKQLRENINLTQKQLGEILNISDKTVSKWETDKGLPDICLVEELAAALGVSIAELFAGEKQTNSNRSANMRRTKFYVCPVCGNIIASVGKGSFSCCGITLPALEAEEDDDHIINIEIVDDEYHVFSSHPMTKKHYISFIAYVTGSTTEIVKLYPEQDISVRLRKKGHGRIYMYCCRHGLYSRRV
ncbi:MAG: helix-turn-helix domain-containing protein [Oscillospiraceae bacterium]|nr:helix-turn-helix domain-containing protein [Oscillospiraceae bacterium]